MLFKYSHTVTFTGLGVAKKLMETNPKLKQRPRNPNMIRVGSAWEYWPQSITHNKNIKLGTTLVVIKKPTRTKVPMVEVALVADSQKVYSGATVSSIKYTPEMENVYHVLVSDLTKGKPY